MKIQCPKCNTAYNIDDSRIPQQGGYVRCKKCQNRFRVEKPIKQSGIQPEEFKRQPEKEEPTEKNQTPAEELGEESKEAVGESDEKPTVKDMVASKGPVPSDLAKTSKDAKWEGTAKEKLTVTAMVGQILFIVIFFPVIIVEKLFRRRINVKIAYVLLAIAAFLGVYDLIYGIPGDFFYGEMIAFSDKSLINSMSVLAVTKIGGLISYFINPAVAEVLNKVSDLIANGVLALGFQSILLRLVKAGYLLKYFLAFGFVLCAFRRFERMGQKIVILTFLFFIAMPAVVFTETFVYNHYSTEIKTDLEEKKEKIGSVIGLPKDVASASYYSSREKLSKWFGDEEGAEKFELLKKEKAGVTDRVKALAKGILDSLMYMLLLVLFTCILAPILAYFLLIKVFFSLLKDKNSTFCARTFQIALEAH